MEAVAGLARRRYRGLTWLGRARRSGVAPENHSGYLMKSLRLVLEAEMPLGFQIRVGR